MATQTAYLMESAPGPETVINGRRCLYFGGTGYYGLHNHPQLLEAGVQAWRSLGTNTATSRAGMGTAPIHLQVEAAAARFFDTGEAAYVASGYLSNMAGVHALNASGAFDVILVDEHAHYCVYDAARSSGASVYPFAHRDPADLERQLSRHVKPGQTPLVMSDGLFPGMGLIAPLPGYLEVLENYAGLVWLDDAHAAGILGPNGRGTADHFGVGCDRVYTSGTLSKAFGGFGGIVTGSKDFITRVRNSPVMIAASAPPSPIAAATLAGLELVTANPEWRRQLGKNASFLKQGLSQLGLDIDQTEVPIVTFTLGSEANMRRIHSQLIERGIAIQYAEYSGISKGGVLRAVVFSTHTRDQIERLIDELRGMI